MARGMKKQRKKRARRRRKARERLWWLLDYPHCGDDMVDATRLALLSVARGARKASKSLRRFIEVAGGLDFGWHHRAVFEHLAEGHEMRMDIPASVLRGAPCRANDEADEAFRERIRARLRERMATKMDRVKANMANKVAPGRDLFGPGGTAVPRPQSYWKGLSPTPFQRVRVDDDGAHDYESERRIAPDQADATALPRPIQVGQLDALTKGDDDGNE
jgi:hypothetical protein